MTAAVRFSLPAEPAAARKARRRLEALDILPASVAADAKLVISEIVSNAVLHADLDPHDRIDVAIRIEDRAMVIEVDDHGAFSKATHTIPRRPDGVGLHILDSLCEWWNAHDGRVIARLALPG